MPTARVIIVGNEILQGEVADTNTQYLARVLRGLGFDLVHAQCVADDIEAIARAVAEAIAADDLTIAAGGLGPTVDDVTREAVAEALGRELEYRPELWAQILDRFAAYGAEPTENNKRQAYVPIGALPLSNPVGTAPCFIVEEGSAALIVLPGVPAEMRHVLEAAVVGYLAKRFPRERAIEDRAIHTVGVGESRLDSLIEDLARSQNPKLGLVARPGQVDVRLTATADDRKAAVALLDEAEARLKSRLGRRLYGKDDDTLESVALGALDERGWSLVVVECGLQGRLVGRCASQGAPFAAGAVLPLVRTRADLEREVGKLAEERNAPCGLGVQAATRQGRTVLWLYAFSPATRRSREVPHGGHVETAVDRAANLGLDLLRDIAEH